MTLLTYQVFKTVSEIKSFHKAADLLGLTPSAISHAISSMENELGFSLLIRSKAGVTLTNYGEKLLPYVNAVLNSDESLQQAIAQFNGLKQGKVKIGVFSSVCTNWLPDIMNSFNRWHDYPECTMLRFCRINDKRSKQKSRYFCRHRKYLGHWRSFIDSPRNLDERNITSNHRNGHLVSVTTHLHLYLGICIIQQTTQL